MAQATRKQTILAARIAYLSLGILLAMWAALVPYAKHRLGVDESIFGILLFFIGLGGFSVMPFAGALTNRTGCRAMLCFALPAMFLIAISLAILNSLPLMAVALVFFGGLMGLAEVAIKVQCALIERAVGRQMMSSFHAMYSLGGITGAAAMAALLGMLELPFWPTVIISALAIVVIFSFCYRNFLTFADFDEPEKNAHNNTLSTQQTKKKLISIPKGIVLAMGCVCFMIYTCEGVILDWAALFLNTERGIPTAQCGFAYASFAATMTLARLCGDRLALRFGSERLMVTSALIAMVGLMVTILGMQIWQVFLGIALVGAGYANLSPMLFSLAARKTSICLSETVAGIATIGYLGLLVGPAVMGIVANIFDLSVIFMVEAVIMLAVAVCAVRLHRA
ncbi:MAG: MFS transporter [Pseudomonadota bacterium]